MKDLNGTRRLHLSECLPCKTYTAHLHVCHAPYAFGSDGMAMVRTVLYRHRGRNSHEPCYSVTGRAAVTAGRLTSAAAADRAHATPIHGACCAHPTWFDPRPKSGK